MGIFKSFFFGAAIALVSCHHCFHCDPGAQGVGRAATNAFVVSFVLLLVLYVSWGIGLVHLHCCGNDSRVLFREVESQAGPHGVLDQLRADCDDDGIGACDDGFPVSDSSYPTSYCSLPGDSPG